MDNFIAQVTIAILKGEDTFQGIPIPSGQTSGTMTQQKSYAQIKAEEFLKDFRPVEVNLERTVVYKDTKRFLVHKDIKDESLTEHLTKNSFIDKELEESIHNSIDFETSDSWSFSDKENNFGGSL